MHGRGSPTRRRSLRGGDRREHNRRYRERVRLGLMCATVELSARHIDALVRNRWLIDVDTHATVEVVAALQRLIDDMVSR